MTMLTFDANVASDEFSVVGRRVEIEGVPYAGLPEITGGGVTKEGQTYVRDAAGGILYLSRGIKTPQDYTTVTTLGTFRALKAQLDIAAVARGLTAPESWMDVPVTIVTQIQSGNPLAEPHTETMLLSVMSWQSETAAGGDGSKCTIVWKQEVLPKLGA
jgi:hypothetical protein